MEFSAKKDDLNKTLSHVQSIVEKRAAIPVLANVKLTINNDNTLELLATDMDICIEDRIKAEVKLIGNDTSQNSITIPAGTLWELVRKFPDNTNIEFKIKSLDEDIIHIKAGLSEFSLPTIKADEFPSFEDATNTLKFNISSEILRTLFLKTRHAISNEETRYYLNGVFLHSAITEDGTAVLSAVSTDGHRLAKAQTLQPAGSKDMPSIIVPKKTVTEVIKLLDGFTGEVEVALTANKIIMSIGSSIITSKLIDGKFPDYERVIPKGNDKTLKVSKKDLSSAIELVTAISNDRTKAVRFIVNQNKLVVSATSEVNGNAKGTQEINAEFNSGEQLSIGFNSRYVLDALSAIDGDNVNLLMSGNLGAVIAMDPADDAGNFKYILMPMQV